MAGKRGCGSVVSGDAGVSLRGDRTDKPTGGDRLGQTLLVGLGCHISFDGGVDLVQNVGQTVLAPMNSPSAVSRPFAGGDETQRLNFSLGRVLGIARSPFRW